MPDFRWVETLGVPFAVIVVLIWFMVKREESYLALVSKLADLIQNNTKAMTELSDITRQNCQAMSAHDERVAQIGEVVKETNRTAREADSKLDRMLKLTARKGEVLQ